MDLSSADNVLVDSTNDSKPSQKSVRRRWRPSESDSFVKLSETTATATVMTIDKPENSERTDEPESTLTRLVLSPALFVSYLISLYVVDKKEHTTYVSNEEVSYETKHVKQKFITPKGHRKWIKSELVNAFEIRGKIMMILLTLGLFLSAAFSWGFFKIFMSRRGSEQLPN